MTHNYLSGGLPTAIITRKRNEMRSYERNNDSVIYLNDKDTFEIRLFNPLHTRVGVEIRINGQSTSEALLVLNPGQDVTIERYLDSKRKFMFETYHIDANNPSAKKAIEDNGLIEIFFYNEKTYHNFSTDTGYLNYSSGFNDTTTGNFYSTLTNNTSSMNVDMFSNKSLPSKKLRKRVKSSKSEETGRIGKGDKSNQRFEKVNVEFETYYFD